MDFISIVPIRGQVMDYDTWKTTPPEDDDYDPDYAEDVAIWGADAKREEEC